MSTGWAGRRARSTGAGRTGALTLGRQAGAGAGALGRGRAGRAGVRGARASRARGRGRSARESTAGRLGRERPGVLLGQLAVHSMHATYFWLGLTRYFSGVRFLDIVREPGS